MNSMRLVNFMFYFYVGLFLVEIIKNYLISKNKNDWRNNQKYQTVNIFIHLLLIFFF
jgi:hypothetical protein